MTYTLEKYQAFLGKIKSPIIAVIDGRETEYSDGVQELLKQQFDKEYVVRTITARDSTIVLTFEENSIVPNDLNAEWVKEHVEKTGQEISFF